MYTKRFAFLGAIAMVAMVGCETATGLDSDAVEVTSEALAVATSSPVFKLPVVGVPEGVPDASSTVRRTKNGVNATLHTSGLTPGNAYTMWMVVFNNPAACAGVPCLEPDLFNPDVAGNVIYVTGHVADDEEGTFSGRVAKGDTSNTVPLDEILDGMFDFLPPPVGLTELLDAEIHLVVRNHGAMIPDQMPGQIHTFEGGCTEVSSLGLGSGPNVCADIQASIHAAP